MTSTIMIALYIVDAALLLRPVLPGPARLNARHRTTPLD
jgi:hypothetical protein